MAIYYFRNTGSTSWNVATNWSLTDGGGATGAVPTSADDAYFTNLSGNCIVNAVSQVCKSLVFSGVGGGNYSGTFTWTNPLTISGNITYSATMTVAGTNGFLINTSATLTSNGKTHPGTITFAGTAQTYTLADNWIVNGTVTSSAATSLTINNNGTTKTFTCNGSLAINSAGMTGTADFIMGGTGTLSSSISGAVMRNNLTINTTGTITGGTNFSYGTGTFTYTAGTTNFASTNFYIFANSGTAATLNTNGINFSTITLLGTTSTIFLTSNLTATGTVQHVTTGGTTYTFSGAYNVNTASLTTTAGRTIATTAGATIVFNSTGTLLATGALQAAMVFNTAGTLTIGATVLVTAGSITYTAGTIDTTTNSSLLAIQGNFTLNTAGMTWYNVTCSATPTVTINSLLSISNTLTSTTSTTYAGTSGWTTANYTLTTVGITITYVASKTYTITSALTLTGTAASNIVFVSGTPGTRYNFVLNSGATQDVSFVNATDADSSAAQTIWDFKGSRSNTLNWNALTAPLTISSTFSS